MTGKTTQVKPAVTRGQATESCYQMDMGKDGEIPRNRRVWYKTGMSSTTLDLFDGTTKATYQVRPAAIDRCNGGGLACGDGAFSACFALHFEVLRSICFAGGGGGVGSLQ